MYQPDKRTPIPMVAPPSDIQIRYPHTRQPQRRSNVPNNTYTYSHSTTRNPSIHPPTPFSHNIITSQPHTHPSPPSTPPPPRSLPITPSTILNTFHSIHIISLLHVCMYVCQTYIDVHIHWLHLPVYACVHMQLIRIPALGRV